MPPPLVLVRAVDALRTALVGATRRMLPPQYALMDVMTSHWRGDALEALTRLGVVDALGRSAKTADALARETGLHADALRRVLRGLAGDGLLDERPGGLFALNALTRPLLTDAPDSMRNAVLMSRAKHQRAIWSNLDATLRSGHPVFLDLYEKDLWRYLLDEPREGEVFHAAMREFTRDLASDVAASYPFGRFDTIADFGGGAGALIGAILRAHPRLRGVNYDGPDAMKAAPETLAALGVTDRCELRAGDMFEAVPQDVDAFVMKNILHALDDDACRVPLALCRAALKPEGRLFLVEMIVPEAGPYLAYLDLVMLLGSGGKERTRAEFAALAARNGFELVAVHENPSPNALLEWRPV